MEQQQQQQQIAVVFDFDETLTVRHLHYLIEGKGPLHLTHIDKARFPYTRREELLERREFVVEWVFGGEERVSALRELLQALSHHADLIISSNGQLPRILAALKQVGLETFFRYINARGRLENVVWDRDTGRQLSGSGSKENFIAEFVGPHYAKCVLFIDNEMLPRYGIKLHGKKYHLLNMRPEQKGMDEEDFARLRAAVEECAHHHYLTLSNCYCETCGKQGAELCDTRCSVMYCSEACYLRK